jgi:hypothetical protein
MNDVKPPQWSKPTRGGREGGSSEAVKHKIVKKVSFPQFGASPDALQRILASRLMMLYPHKVTPWCFSECFTPLPLCCIVCMEEQGP